MPLSRVLEVEAMDSAAEAADYNAMDHSAVNALFVADLLATGVFAGKESLEVLDIGAGTALIPIELCRRTPECRVLAVDLAAHMLDLAKYNVEAAGLTHRIQLAQIDAKALPFSNGRFDVVMSNSIIHHIPEPIHALREAVRVTRPFGLLFIRDLQRPDDEDSLAQLVQTYAGSENAHSQKMFADSLHAALSLEEIRGLVGKLGFPAESVQQTSDRHWTFVVYSPSTSYML